MRKQLLAMRRLRLEFVLTEENVVAIGERVRSHARTLMSRSVAGVHADMFEVRAEARFHEVTHGGWQGRSSCGTHVRGGGRALRSGRFALHLGFRDLAWSCAPGSRGGSCLNGHVPARGFGVH